MAVKGEDRPPENHDRDSSSSAAMSVQQPELGGDAQQQKSKIKKPSFVKRAWLSLELDVFTILLMAKGGIAPALALSLLQINVIANHFTTVGYLVAIISVIGLPILPRAKFIQSMITNLILLCTAAAMALLVGYCATQARAHDSTGTPQRVVQYDSSASAVCAIWLFFQVYVGNAARAKYPQLQIPIIMYSIFSVVACINLPRFPTMPLVMAFVEKLLEAFLFGLACATAVSLLILPVTVRQVVFKEMTGYLGLLQKCLLSHQGYLSSLEDPEKLAAIMTADHGKEYRPSMEMAALSGTVAAITELHTKLQGDLPFAKREIAVGKLGAEELGSVAVLLRRIMLPSIGLSTLNEFLERAASFHGWSEQRLNEGMSERENSERTAIVKDWSENIKSLRRSFDAVIEVTCEGLEHAALQLQLKKQPRSSGSVTGDVEADAQSSKPGESRFAERLEQTIEAHHSGKLEMLRDWCKRHGMELSGDFFDSSHQNHASFMAGLGYESQEEHSVNQRQLYMLLYMEFLVWSIAQAVLALVQYCDKLVAHGTMSKSRLILPGWRRIKKWVKTFINYQEGPTEEPRGVLGDLDQAVSFVNLGQAYNKRKDPEHLPARNVFEKTGDAIRWIPRILKSDASQFGFRVAVATMSIAIIGYLKSTQQWFVVHRVLWALIMIAISMTPTAGQSIFSFALRIIGTVIAMVAAFLCYYIPDKHRAGVIVLLWLFTSMGMWVLLKRPQLAVVGILSVVTNVLILGYALEVEKLGQRIATSNGQEYLPLYEIGPYRLATVCGGLLVAFIFTIFPFPITEHSLLRQNAGGALYLLANYYSVVHESIQARIKDAEGNPNDKKSVGNRLKKIRAKVFTKQILMLTNLQAHAAFQKYEIPVGGQFPRAQYDTLIESISRITRYIALLSYSSESLIEYGENGHHLSQWSRDLKALLASLGPTSHEITSMLSLLSASMTNGQPLPPYMASPQPFYLSKKLNALDPDILSMRHINEPEYAVFAVFQVASRCIIFELDALLKIVKELVGELDFSFRVVQSENSSQTLIASQRGNIMALKDE